MTVLDLESAIELNEYAKAHYYYQDLALGNFFLPASVIQKSSNPNLLVQNIQKIVSLPKKEAVSELEKLSTGLESKIEKSFKAMFRAIVLFNIQYRNYSGVNRDYTKEDIQEVKSLKQECFSKNEFDTPECNFNFAVLFIKMGLISDGVDLLQRAINLNDGYIIAHINLALIYTFCHHWQKGLYHARKVKSAGHDVGANLIDLCLTACSHKLGLKKEGKTRFNAVEKGFSFSINDAKAYFPKVDDSTLDHSFHDKDVVYIPSDTNYFFIHSLPLICSVAKNSPNYAIHIHIMNPTKQLLDFIPELRKKIPAIKGFSIETANVNDYCGPHAYYSTVRDFRLYQLVVKNKNRFMRIDADMLVMKSLELIDELKSNVSFAHNSKKLIAPFWEDIDGYFWSFKQSPEALEILQNYGMLMFDNFKNKTYSWFGGQVFMSYLYDTYKNKYELGVMESSDVFDITHGDEAIVWCITNGKLESKKYMEKKHYFLKEFGLENYIFAEELKAIENLKKAEKN